MAKKKKKKAAKKVKKKVVKKKAKKVAKKAKKKVTKKAKKKVAKKKVAKKKAKKVAKKKTVKKKVAKKKVAKKNAKKVTKKAKKKVAKKVAKKTKKKVATKAPVKKTDAKKEKAAKKSMIEKVKSVAKKITGKKATKAPIKVALKEDPIIEEEEIEEIDPDSLEFEEEIILTDAEGRRYCKVPNCDQIGVVDGYCRYHYLLHWKRIQIRKKIITEGKLDKYIDELTAKYPLKFIDVLRRDLKSEKDFMVAIRELEIEDNIPDDSQSSEEDDQHLISEMRGASLEDGIRTSDDDY